MPPSNGNIFRVTSPLCIFSKYDNHCGYFIACFQCGITDNYEMNTLVEAETKWLPFCRSHVRIHFLALKLYCNSCLTKFTPKGAVTNNLSLVQIICIASVLMCPVLLFTPQPFRLEGYCRHGSGGRAGGRLPNLRNPYLCNRLTDFLHSKFWGIV